MRRLDTGQVEITSQNHSFCIDPDSLKHTNVETTHINLNDGTLEGLRHRDYPLFSRFSTIPKLPQDPMTPLICFSGLST